MKAQKFAEELKEAGLTLYVVDAPEPEVVVRQGIFGDELAIRAVKVRHEFKPQKSFIILEVQDQYPTEDSYMRACRALHWRDAQLRANGIKPVRIPTDGPQEPPEDFDWVEAQKT